jgi:hypothetical protein
MHNGRRAPAGRGAAIFVDALRRPFSEPKSTTPPKRSMFAQRRWFSHRALKLPSQGFVCTERAKVHVIFRPPKYCGLALRARSGGWEPAC